MITILTGKTVKVGVIGILAVVGLAAAVLLSPPAGAGAAEEEPLDCLSCHTRGLGEHQVLGSGSQACWTCHDRTTIGRLELFNGEKLPLEASTPICGQCHSNIIDLWAIGEHDFLPKEDGNGEILACIKCHNPHSPGIDTSAIIEAPENTRDSSGQLECLSCHRRELKAHDKLGTGSDACRACHSGTTMGVLHLADGSETLNLADFIKLCAQCHQDRFQDWSEGIHGAPSWNIGNVNVHGEGQVGCIGCHDPHQPQILLLGITKPPPEPAPSAPEPPTDLLLILGISVLGVAAIGVILGRKGEGI